MHMGHEDDIRTRLDSDLFRRSLCFHERALVCAGCELVFFVLGNSEAVGSVLSLGNQHECLFNLHASTG